MSKAVEKIKKAIDKATAPEEMSESEAKKVFLKIREDIDSRLECMRAVEVDLGDDGDNDDDDDFDDDGEDGEED